MLTSRLVHLIERNAEELTQVTVKEILSDTRTPSYSRLDPKEYHTRVFTVIHDLGKWLDSESDTAVETAYRHLGQRRFREGIPLAEVVCALMLTKQTIRRYIYTEGWMDSALELCQQLEFYNLISRFFDRAIYFTVASYEEQARGAAKTRETPPVQKRRSEDWESRKAATAVR